MSRAVIALGSNLGRREATLLAAVRELADSDGVELVAVSGIVETPALKPHGIDQDAPAYLNGIAIVETSIAPLPLLTLLRRIEAAYGRVRTERWGDRTLDLDLIDYDAMVLESDELTLPHPRAHERAFVLEPWLDADPHAVLSGTPVVELLSRLEPARRVELVETSHPETSHPETTLPKDSA